MEHWDWGYFAGTAVVWAAVLGALVALGRWRRTAPRPLPPERRRRGSVRVVEPPWDWEREREC